VGGSASFAPLPLTTSHRTRTLRSSGRCCLP